jgi:hypothetical protein
VISAILEALFDKFLEASKTGKIIIIGLVTVGLVAVGVPAFKAVFPERSAKAFCKEYNKEKENYLAKYGKSPGEGVEAFTQLMGAVSEMPQLFARLAKRAPDEIQSDVQNISDTLKAQQKAAIDNAGNPLAGLVASMGTGLMAYSSWVNVGEFVEANCVTAEERQQRAEAQAAAVKQVETDKAKSDLEYALTSLSDKLAEDLKLDYQHHFDSVKEAEGYAKATLADYRQRIADHGAFCDESLWSDAADMEQIDHDRGVSTLDVLKNELYTTDDLEEDSAGLSTAADALRAIEPSASELDPVEGKLAQAQALITRINEANAAAVSKMKKRIKIFDDYLAEAKELAKTKC